jgi:hypothetical protein
MAIVKQQAGPDWVTAESRQECLVALELRLAFLTPRGTPLHLK